MGTKPNPPIQPDPNNPSPGPVPPAPVPAIEHPAERIPTDVAAEMIEKHIFQRWSGVFARLAQMPGSEL